MPQKTMQKMGLSQHPAELGQKNTPGCLGIQGVGQKIFGLVELALYDSCRI